MRSFLQKRTTDEFARLSRRELTYAACDALASNGKKPSVNLVREQTMVFAGIKRGSSGDVQGDIDSWYQDLFAQKREGTINGIPDSTTSLFRGVWQAALELAEAEMEGDRTSFETVREELMRAQKCAVLDADSLREQLTTIRAQLISSNLAMAAKDEKNAGLHFEVAQVSERLLQLRNSVEEKTHRIDSFKIELAQKTEELAQCRAHNADERNCTERIFEDMRSDVRFWQEKFSTAMQDLRDARAEACQDTLIGLEIALAGAKGTIMELQERLANHKDRISELNAELAQRTAER